MKKKLFSPEQKYQIIKEHLMSKRSISATCEQYDVGVNSFYRWQEQFFKGALDAFVNHKCNRKLKSEAKREKQLLDEIQRKDSIIAEIMAENLELKKNSLTLRNGNI